MKEDLAGGSGIEVSDHVNPKSKVNQDLTEDNGITNPILHLTPIGIVFNYLRNIQRSCTYQQNDLREPS